MRFSKEFKPALKTYLFTWVVAAVLFLVAAGRSGMPLEEIFQQWWKVMTNSSFLIAVHILFLLLYILFLIVRYTRRGHKKAGWKLALKRISFVLILPAFGLFFSFKGVVMMHSAESYVYDWDFSVENTSETASSLYEIDGKHRGMSVFWSRDNNQKELDILVKDNMEWVAVIPFLDQEHEETPELRSSFNAEWKQRDSMMIARIRQLQQRDVRVHLKPHIWLFDGWRSNIKLSQDDWTIWFDSYRETMVHYAKIAEAEKVDLFCIGTELRTAIQQSHEEWFRLIKEVKEVYSGKLTYAANWDDPIENVPFWDAMDYIGIQAYFPLTENTNPELDEIKEGWQRHIKILEAASERYKKPILFTEVGYRSDISATIKPWEWGNSLGILYNKKSDRTQQLAFEALFESLWDKPWFAGCYVWQWHTSSTPEGALQNVDFSPRYKPAENTLAKWYGTKGAILEDGN